MQQARSIIKATVLFPFFMLAIMATLGIIVLLFVEDRLSSFLKASLKES